MIEVLKPGLHTTLQDAGRKSYEAYGMPASGAFDPYLAQIANKLAGNALNAPLLEFAMIGPSLRFDSACHIAITGFGTKFTLDGNTIPEYEAIPVSPNQVLSFVSMDGWFGYIAVSGSFQAEPVLGSVAVYAAGGIGARMEKSNRLDSAGDAKYRPCTILKQSLPAFSPAVVQILPGLHSDSFSKVDLEQIAKATFRMDPQSDRMGIRLNGNTIRAPRVVRSAPALPGAIQIPPSGNPLILGPDGPTTGGYPQAAILCRTGFTTLACTRPGAEIKLEWTDMESAKRQTRKRAGIFENEALWKPL